MRATHELRWAYAARNDLDPVLQQKWISDDAKAHEWRAIPVVVLSEPTADPSQRLAYDGSPSGIAEMDIPKWA